MLRRTVAFAALSGMILLLAGFALSYLHHSYAERELEQMAERNNLNLTRVFANTLWLDIRDHVLVSETLAPEEMRASPQVTALHKRMAKVMHGSSIAEVTLYNLKGRIVYSTDVDRIGSIRERSRGFVEAASGRVASALVWRDHIDTLEGTVSNRNVVSSYMPLTSSDQPGHIAAVFEVYDDVTDILAETDRNFRQIMIVVGGVMLLVYVGLVAVVHRNYRAVAKEHAINLQLSATVARSEAANQAKSAFLANITHELRTPLNAVIGFAEIIKDERLGPVGVPEYKDFALDIHASGQHLLGIVNDILDMTKAEAGALSIHPDKVDIAELIRQVERMIGQAAAAQNLILRVEVEKDLDAVQTDAARLRQVLLNLLSNAIKFTPAGGTVSVTARRQRNQILVEITDTGIGIAPEDLLDAIMPFGQIDSCLARRHQGAGLGLPLAKKLTELLGGRFDIESRVGSGTRVKLSLPSGVRAEKTSKGQGGSPATTHGLR